MADPRLLIVEDDELVQNLMAAFLRREGFEVSMAATGREMLAIIDTEALDLVLLDLTLPDEDGLSLARQVRARCNLPILVITARKTESDRSAAMEIGADDYLTKPFEPDDMVARVRKLLGAKAPLDISSGRMDIRRFEGWTVNFDTRSVSDPQKKPIELTRAEFNLLAALVKAPDRILTRAYLLDAVSHDADSPTERLIDVLISRIRKKIEPDPRRPRYITTVVGCGYKFNATQN